MGMAAAATASSSEKEATATATSSAMEATATAITTVAAVGPPPPTPEKYTPKTHLQVFADRVYKKPPVYRVECEGEYHQLKFKCTVEVGGQQFSSTGSFNRKKEAEHDAARVAYEILSVVGEDDFKEAFELIDQDVVFCKSILNEFSVKTKTNRPSYSMASRVSPFTLFAATVVFDGNSYTGESAPTKKEAEQSAARAAIKSILAQHNTCMVEIVRSKKQFITAVRSSGSTPATFTPIQFTRPVSYAAYPVHGGINAVPAVGPAVGTSGNPSSANVGSSESKKRKGRP